MLKICRSVPILLIAFAVVSFASSASAHHPGGIGNTGGAGPINTLSASTLEKGRTVVGFTLDYTSLDELRDARLIAETGAGNEGVHSLGKIKSYGLFVGYGLTSDLTLTLRLPYIRRDGIRAAEDHGGGGIEIEDHGATSGIGDLSILSQYRFLKRPASQTEASILLGVKAPTGETDEMDGDEHLDAEFQPGSGSWDASFGLSVSQRFGYWSFDSNALYTIVSKGTQRTDLGDQLLLNAAVSYRFVGASGDGPMALSSDHHDHKHAHSGPSVDIVLELNGEWQDKQEIADISDPNSGGTVVYVSPGLRLSQDAWSGFVSVGIPFVTNLNGVQADPDWRLTTGTTVSF